jgi:hypothetical protein
VRLAAVAVAVGAALFGAGPGAARSLPPPTLLAGNVGAQHLGNAQNYPAVVAQALAELAPKLRYLPLGGPTTLPEEPPSRAYLTALTSVTPHGWLVRVMKARHPYAVDNPAIESQAAHAVQVATFGVVRPDGRPPRQAGAGMADYLWRQALAADGEGGAAGGPLVPPGRRGRTVALGDAISGRLVPVPSGAVSLVWHEGEWTLVVMDTTARTAVALARPVVAYLHRAFLPPHPGLVAIRIGVHGLVTRLAWLSGGDVFHVSNHVEYKDNPVAACAMAVGWQAA